MTEERGKRGAISLRMISNRLGGVYDQNARNLGAVESSSSERF
jgi:hypothetical protein